MIWNNWDKVCVFTPTREDISSAGNSDKALLKKKFRQMPLSNLTKAEIEENFIEIWTFEQLLEEWQLQGVFVQVIIAILASYALFFGLGGYLQWYYYMQRKDKSDEWKCQPRRFLTADNERHEIFLGSICLFMNATTSGILSTYIKNGGNITAVYFDIHDYGWFYFFTSFAICFLLQDGAAYYYHRMLHVPFFYRNFHKWHHRYPSPTAFGALAMHPLESFFFEVVLLLPIFIVPFHFVVVIICFYYHFYYGLIDHSGIEMDSFWPWQPPTRFHDDHHKYFHCNFGLNSLLLDRFHGTLRQTDRQYGEDVFGGKGVSTDCNNN
ncbi:uncharacterized protein LOC143469608 isoform X2 [Clavelina lepadiformis]|uniref:uncharacterized protein LOC143469608 isoform X2 n=1 Tax=Clavelina lepadiformis TaxID=159417 RepID=UPI0040420097